MDFITMALGDDVTLLEEGDDVTLLEEGRQIREEKQAPKRLGETSSVAAAVSTHASTAEKGRAGGDQAGSRFWDDFCLYLYRRTSPQAASVLS